MEWSLDMKVLLELTVMLLLMLVLARYVYVSQKALYSNQ